MVRIFATQQKCFGITFHATRNLLLTLSLTSTLGCFLPTMVHAEESAVAVTTAEPNSAEQIRANLQTQVDAWNQGDIDRFMKTYWNSPELTFCSRGTTTRGWQQTLENYKKRYPSAEAMGKVDFRQLEVTMLGAEGAMVLGRWQLQRENDPLKGNFTLVFRKIDGEWLIIHDHTSLEVPEP